MGRANLALRAAGIFRELSRTALQLIWRQSRPASLAARRDSSEGSASGRGFLAFRRDIRLIRRGIHQAIPFGGISQFSFHQPSPAVPAGVYSFPLVLLFSR